MLFRSSLLKRFASWMLLPIKRSAHAVSAIIGFIVEKGRSKIPVLIISKIPFVFNLLVVAACIVLLYRGYRVIVPAKYESVMAAVSPETGRLACEETEHRTISPTEQFIDACNNGNYVEAARFQSSVDQNDVNVQFWLGCMYEKGLGVAKDAVEAVKWYQKAAEKELAVAQYALGLCYDNGEGVAKNVVEAVKWYRKAAEQEIGRAHV